ncbi:MAG TPA: hypothetical protein VGG56_14315 [Terracidiphilus sp.]|jgi:hypothetical protein
MAVVQQELTAEKTTRKTGSTTTTNKKRRERAGEGAAGVRAAQGDGAERLRQAADRRVGRNSAKLANLLTDKALAGDLASTKMLVALAEGKKPMKEVEKLGEVKKPVRSLALRLAAEPRLEWPKEERKEIGQEG